MLEVMEIGSRIEIEKFNGHNFELWKIKMEYLLVDWELWVNLDLGTIVIVISMEYCEKLDRKERSTI